MLLLTRIRLVENDSVTIFPFSCLIIKIASLREHLRDILIEFLNWKVLLHFQHFLDFMILLL